MKANAYLVPAKGIIRVYDNLNLYPGLVSVLGKVVRLNNTLNCIEVPQEDYKILEDFPINVTEELKQFIGTQVTIDILPEEYWQSLLKNVILRDFQVQFLQWFESRRQLVYPPKGTQRGVVCSTCCGSGKSLISLAADQHLRKQGLIDNTLIICRRNNEQDTWVAHLDTYIRIPYIIIEGNAKERKEAIEEFKKEETKLALIHYEALRKHGEGLAGIVDHLIIDEAQHIANPSSQQSIATDLVAKQAKYVLELSGGVAQNRIATQLYHPLHLCDRKAFPSFSKWRNDWCSTEPLQVPLIVHGRRIMDRITKKPVFRVINQITGIREPEKLAKYVAGYMFQRSIHEIARQLPEVTRQIWRVELSKEQQRVYMKIRDSVAEEVKGLSVPSALIKLLKLHQCCSTLTTLGLEDISAKADAATEFVLENIPEGSKALIFSQWVDMVHSVYSRLKEQGVNALLMTGEILKKKERNEIRKQFREDPSVKALVVTMQLESTGGSYEEANYAIILDRMHAVLVNEQAESRVIRLTSKLPITIINFITTGTIEEVQLQILNRKLKNITDVMSPADTFTKQDISDMLNIKPIYRR